MRPPQGVPRLPCRPSRSSREDASSGYVCFVVPVAPTFQRLFEKPCDEHFWPVWHSFGSQPECSKPCEINKAESYVDICSYHYRDFSNSLLGLQEHEQHEALQAARQRQITEAFHCQYAPRAGIESTHAQGIRRCGLRHTRYMGLAKTHLQHLATAAALNFVQLGEWLTGTPRAKTRCSPFAALNAA